MGCKQGKSQEPQLPSMASPQQEEAFANAQKLPELILDFQLQLEFAVVKPEDAGDGIGMVSINGPGSVRWFQMERMAAKCFSPSNSGLEASKSPSSGSLNRQNSPTSGSVPNRQISPTAGGFANAGSQGSTAEPVRDDLVVRTKEGEARFQLVANQRSSGSRVKHMLLGVNANNSETTLMYSFSFPRSSSSNGPVVLSGNIEIEAQCPAQELPQVSYTVGNAANSFSLMQAANLACCVVRVGQSGSHRYSATIEPGNDVVLYVGLICGTLHSVLFQNSH